MYSNKVGFGGKKIPNNYDHTVMNRDVDVIIIDDAMSIEVSYGGYGHYINPKFNHDIIPDLKSSPSYKQWVRLCRMMSSHFNLLTHTRVSRYKELKHYTDQGYKGKYCIDCFYINIWLNVDVKDDDIVSKIKEILEDKLMELNIDDKIFIRMKKLYNLVQSGATDGEKDAATNQLARLLMKYNIEYDDIIDKLRDKEPTSIRGFRTDSELEKTLLVQIICLRLDVKAIQRCNKSGSKWFTCELTDREFLLIKDEYDHYKKHLSENLNDFVLAFLMKNGLVGTATREDEAKDNVLTPEQAAKAHKLSSMLQGMDYVPKNQVKLTETSGIN